MAGMKWSNGLMSSACYAAWEGGSQPYLNKSSQSKEGTERNEPQAIKLEFRRPQNLSAIPKRVNSVNLFNSLSLSFLISKLEITSTSLDCYRY